MNAAGEIAGALIALAWLVMGWWMVTIGRHRSGAAATWAPVVGTIVDKHGATDGLLLRNPHVRYVGPDGSEYEVPSKSRGDIWSPGQPVDILVNPAAPEEAMLAIHAGRAQVYLVVGWFIIVVAVLTFIASALLAWATPH